MHGCRTTPHDAVRLAISILCQGATALHIPIISSVVPLESGHKPQAIDELADVSSLARLTVGVFADDSSRIAIEATGRQVIALGGISTEIAVLRAALGALEAGLEVHVLTDVCGGLSARTERAAFRQMEAAGAILSSVPSLLMGMISSLAEPPGQSVLSAVSRLWS